MRILFLLIFILPFYKYSYAKDLSKRSIVDTVIESITKLEKQSSAISNFIADQAVDRQLLKKIFLNKNFKQLNYGNFETYKNNRSSNFNLHLSKIKFRDLEDDLFQDDIYLYYVVTNGTSPMAKTTSTYKNNQKGDSILLSPKDRQVFPLFEGLSNKTNGIIIDITIFESDGDDIEELRKITDIIIDLVFIAQQENKNLNNSNYTDNDLRVAIKTLAHLIAQRNNDDNLKTFSLDILQDNLNQLPKYKKFKKRIKGYNNGSRWEYILSFRSYLSDSI